MKYRPETNDQAIYDSVYHGNEYRPEPAIAVALN